MTLQTIDMNWTNITLKLQCEFFQKSYLSLRVHTEKQNQWVLLRDLLKGDDLSNWVDYLESLPQGMKEELTRIFKRDGMELENFFFPILGKSQLIF